MKVTFLDPVTPEPELKGWRAWLARFTCLHQLCFDVNVLSEDRLRQYPVERMCMRCGARGWPRP